MKIEEMDIDLIKPYKNNPREIPMESVQKVMNSIREFGNNQPIVVDKDNIIVVGHTRWKALKQLGEKKAYIVKKDFTRITLTLKCLNRSRAIFLWAPGIKKLNIVNKNSKIE